MINEPQDAAATILLSRDRKKVLWARRNPELRFLGGFHGFAGGKLDTHDHLADVRNAGDPAMRPLIACAVRETFEEIGVLLVRNGEKLTKGQRISLHDDLMAGREKFADILVHWDLWIDGRDFYYTGFWITPEFSPIRFKTRFFAAICPEKQVPYQAIDEMGEIEFIEPGVAVEYWSTSKVLIAPPVLIAVRELAGSAQSGMSFEESAKRLREHSDKLQGELDHLELNSRFVCLPLRTKTLPPATHTNCFIVGKMEFIVIDAAAIDEIERGKLYSILDGIMADGGVCRAIVVSHLHRDHFGGEAALKAYLNKKHGISVPIVAHRRTAESLFGKTEIDACIEDGDSYTLKDSQHREFDLRVLHTPGHARGHLCFYDQELGFLLSMDNVLAYGSVLIDPPEGNMDDYLESLVRMRDLPNLRFLCGSHGPPVYGAPEKIEGYIRHRLEREKQVANAMTMGAETAEDIAAIVYRDLDPELFPLAVRSAAAHIERLSGNNQGQL